jgi:hypothetical protein
MLNVFTGNFVKIKLNIDAYGHHERPTYHLGGQFGIWETLKIKLNIDAYGHHEWICKIWIS